MNHLAKITLGYVAFCFLSLGVLVKWTFRAFSPTDNITQVIVKAIYNVFLHPLRRYPGSKLWAATRLTWTYSMQSGQFHQHLHELHQQYGPIIRIAPNELSYIDARAWHDIYQPRAGHRHIPKTDKWGKQPPGAPDSIASVDVNAHTRIRRGLMGAFTEHAVNEHASMIESLVDLMIAKLTERATSSDDCATVDLVDWFNFLTFDIAGALSFGKSFESVQNGKAHPWVEITCTFGKGLALVASVNFFSPLDRLLAYTIPRTVREKMNYHKQLVHERFRQRLDREDKRTSPDFVGSVLQYNESKGSTRVTMEEMEANMMTLILAGSETTATVLAAATNALLRHPKVLEKVLGEVRSAFEVQQEITIATVGRLEYLTAVLQECLRLYPPAAVAIPRVIPKEGDIICEQWVPGTVSNYKDLLRNSVLQD